MAANVAADGFGPCKRATQAPHGTIDVKLAGPDPWAAQSAVIAITANSPVNTRIRLICTDIVSAGVFTVRNCIQNFTWNYLFLFVFINNG